jgi:FMN phosphatase YigB (HAD superfamily)
MTAPPPFRDKQAVIFDLDGTLYHQKPVRRAMLARLLRAHLLRPFEGYRTIRFLSAYRRAQEELRNESAADAANRQLLHACERARFDSALAPAIVGRWMEREPLDLLRIHRRAGLVEILQNLRDAGIRLALLSDYPATRKLEALGIAHLFEIVVSAQDPEVGAFKPSPLGLEVTLRRLGVQPGAALYVGDRPDVDSAAARAAGIDCAIFTSATKGAGFTPVRSCCELRKLLLG